MGDDDKPFACMEPGCGMRFANEDHLSVHRLKHEMSLSLNPGGNASKSTANLLFVDQTPTPTKFLRNCEEIGLFSDLNKNPFEEAFKKATENLSEGKAESLQIAGASTEGETLHTPTPHIIIPSVYKESPLARRHPEPPRAPAPPPRTPAPAQVPAPTPPAANSAAVPEYIPLPGPSGELGSTISGKVTSQPSQDASLASETDIDSQSSDTSIPAKPHTPVQPSPTTPTRHVPMSTFVLPPKKAMLANSREQMRIKQEAAAPVDLQISKKDTALSSPVNTSVVTEKPAVHAITTRVVTPVTMATSQAKSLTTTSPLVMNQSASPVTSPPLIPAPASAASPSASTDTKPSQYLLQVMIQMPGGEMVPVHIPAAVANASPAPVAQQPQTVAMTTSTMSGGGMVTTATVAPASSPASGGGSVAGLASSITKQKLKAAIQQNTQQQHQQHQQQHQVMSQQGNIRITPEVSPSTPARPLVTALSSPQLSQGPSTSSMRLSLSPQLSIGSSDSESSMSLTREDADTSTPSKRARRESNDMDDPDDRRKKFLERNRAAAARCRQKKKAWIGNLETKAEELQATNVKLQNEVTLLRSEVAQLKALLLAHKDCPITVQQQSTGQLDLQTVPQLETQSDSISSTSPSTVAMETTSSSPEAIATSALTTMATKGAGGNQQTFTPITIINSYQVASQNQSPPNS